VAAIPIYMGLYVSCRNMTVHDVRMRYAARPYLQEWTDGCIRVSAMLAGAEYMAAIDVENRLGDSVKLRAVQWDSVVKTYSNPNCIRINFRIEPTEKCIDKKYFQNSDIEFGFGRTMEERSDVNARFNFKMAGLMTLGWNETRISPQLCHMEQNWGMDNGRNFWAEFNLSPDQRTGLLKQKEFHLTMTLPFPGIATTILTWNTRAIRETIIGGK
jgi:hypothetical protein